MPYDPRTQHRRSIRLPGYDYTRAGAYFITLVAWHKEYLFGDIHAGQVELTPAGEVVRAGWLHLPHHFHLHLDAWVVMPNHFHGILVIDPVSLPTPTRPVPNLVDINEPRTAIGTRPGSLGAIVQNFKSITTRRINTLQSTPGVPVWQRNYYEHVVRNDTELQQIRTYIANNPAGWHEDQLFFVTRPPQG